MATSQSLSALIDPFRMIPAAGAALNSIFTMVQKIIVMARQITANKKQCQRLGERIERAASYFRTSQFCKRAQYDMGPWANAIESFHAFTEECYVFISQFTDMGYITRFFSSSSHQNKFKDLNDQLSDYYSELTMGFSVEKFANPRQDEYDRQEDYKEMSSIIMQQNQIMAQHQHAHFQFSRQVTDGFRVLSETIEQLTPKSHDQSSDGTKVHNEETVSQMSNFGYSTSFQKDAPQIFPSPASNDIFISGVWSNRYYLYGVWHGPVNHSMKFDAKSNKFYGHGVDNVGQFIFSGSYSKDVKRIQIVQSYKYGTGNPQLNLGHQCMTEMTWNPERRVFEGMMFMPYGGAMIPSTPFEMAFIKSQ